MDKLTERHCQVPPDYYDREIKKNFLLRIWHQNRSAQAGKILNGISPRQILDVGCHGGMMTESISQKFPQAQVFAIDVSSQAIEYGKKIRPRINFQVAEATSLPFADESLDLVTCFDILEHIPNAELALVEIHRVLTSKGELILEIPTENLLFKIVWFWWNHFAGGWVWQETHVNDFSRGKLEKILEESGFRVEETREINCRMLLLVRARKS